MSLQAPERTTYDLLIYGVHLGRILASRAEVIPTGGAETQLFLLGRALAAQGYRVAMACPDVPGGLPRSTAGIDVIVSPEFRSPAHSRSRTKALLGTIKRVSYLVKLPATFDARCTLQRGISGEAFPLALGAKLTGGRFVWASASDADIDRSWLARPSVNWWLFRLATKLADEVVVQTEDQARHTAEVHGVNAVVIPSLCEEEDEASTARDSLLWIGRNTPVKRPLEFVKLAEAAPDLSFKMVYAESKAGEDELDALVRRRASVLSNLDLVDPMPRSELGKLIASSLAVVNTSEVEGMPNVFLEAWARGVPALSLEVDPARLLSEQRLGFVCDGDHQSLLDAARELRDDESLRDELSVRVREYVRAHHSIEACVNRWKPILIPPSGQTSAP